MITVQQLIHQLEKLYPTQLAEEWDQVGLHIGSRNASVTKLMTALDLRLNVVQEAIEHQVDTIIVHHPPIFKPIKRLDLDLLDNQLYALLIKHDITVYALHTNLDIAWNGMNDWLAEELGLEAIEPLCPSTDQSPTIGRIGNLPLPLTRPQLIEQLKTTYHRSELPIIEAKARSTYQRIAILGGSGSDYVQFAADKQADVFITGDISYHHAHTCYDSGLMTVDAGHYIENIFISKMATILQQQFPEITVIASKQITNPFTYE
ncbi:MAG: Nif3-like dinuclear metal center hexameric protein [Aerococcaceae bacterium]|nr:Nif3-like dinuclear metal center hexameric protein [Aerococcaceae bacterium]